MAEVNPAYVKWVEMIKDGETKLVHPGNVENHERAGWVRKYLAAAEAPVDDKAYQSISLPELTEKIVELESKEDIPPTEPEDPKAAEKKAKAEAKAAAKKAKAEAAAKAKADAAEKK